MVISGAGYTGPREIRYLFVDGGCVRAVIKDISARYAGGASLELNYDQLTSGYTKVFYYDALPGKKKEETIVDYEARIELQRRFLDEISSLDRFHVYEGDMRRSRVRRGNEQKKIDVMIAVDMLTHTFRRNMHEATLLTSDLDFKPLLDALVYEGMFVTLWYPPNDTNKELVAAADRRQPFGIRDVGVALAERSKHLITLPHPSYVMTDFEQLGPFTGVWELDDNRRLGLSLKGGGYTVVCASKGKHNLVVSHHDKAFLREYIREVFSIEMPND